VTITHHSSINSKFQVSSPVFDSNSNNFDFGLLQNSLKISDEKIDEKRFTTAYPTQPLHFSSLIINKLALSAGYSKVI
jgi:hypothetical protein